MTRIFSSFTLSRSSIPWNAGSVLKTCTCASIGCSAANAFRACTSLAFPTEGDAALAVRAAQETAIAIAHVSKETDRGRNLIGSSSLRQHCSYAGHFTEINQCRVNVGSISQARVFIGPILQKFLYIAMSRDEAMGPKGNATFIQPACEILGGGFENGCASDDHTELAIDSSQTGQYSFSNFAD